MRTFKAEVARVIAEYIPGEPPADRMAHALIWWLYASGGLKKRKRRRHVRPQLRGAFYGGRYQPRGR